MQFILILSVSFVATLLSAMSGAGAGMITLPAWILMGFPIKSALTSSQVAGALWTPIAARNYLHRISIDWKLIFGLVTLGLIGAYFGASVVVNSDSAKLQKIFGILILVLVLIVSLKKEFGIQTKEPTANRLVTSVLAFPLGFYETFFGSGNGIFSSVMLIKTRGFGLTTALGYYYVISFTWDSFGAFLFLRQGYGNLSLIIPASIGGVGGAYLGSKIGRRKGSGFVKVIFLVLGSVLGLKLLCGW